jgi:hypothetical protein
VKKENDEMVDAPEVKVFGGVVEGDEVVKKGWNILISQGPLAPQATCRPLNMGYSSSSKWAASACSSVHITTRSGSKRARPREFIRVTTKFYPTNTNADTSKTHPETNNIRFHSHLVMPCLN